MCYGFVRAGKERSEIPGAIAMGWLALVLSIQALLFGACGRDLGTPQGVAEEFLDQHYVHINLQEAKKHTLGLALAKVDEEIRLTAGQPIDASTRKPRVHYRLLRKETGGNRASFLYEGTIRADDAPEFKRRWLILARREGDRWWVSNFTELD